MMNNNFMVDYDCAGFCAICHAEVAEFNGSFEIAPGITKPKIKGLKGNHRSQTVSLSDGSQMVVSVCENCYDIKPEQVADLMINVVNGWKKEVEIMQAYVDTKKDLTIIDVPSRGWDETIKLSLQGESDGLNK